MPKPGSDRAPGKKTGGPNRSAERPSGFSGGREEAAPSKPNRSAQRPSGFSGGREEAAETTPWRRAALAIERDRERAAKRADAAGATPAPQIIPKRRDDGRFVIGRLGAPHGVHGDLRVHSYSGETSHFMALKIVELVREGEAPLRLALTHVDADDSGLVMAFEGHGTPELAERLVGREILVDRKAGAPLEADQWYIADLIGLELVDPSSTESYGRVLAICEGGADPLLEIDRGSSGTVLIPFRREFIGDIDLQSRHLVLLAPWILE